MGITADAFVGIVEQTRRILDEGAVAERRSAGVDVVVLAGHEVVPHGVGRPHRETAIAADIPRDAAARRQVPPLLVQPGLSLRESGISRIRETRRRVMEHRALDLLLEVFHPEDRDRVVLDVLPEVGLPPQAVVDGHAVRQAPRVLGVRTEVPVVNEQQVLAAVLERRHAADEEGGEREPGR